MAWTSVILSVISLIGLAFFFLKRRNQYWAKRGVPFVKPKLLWGNAEGMGSKYHFGEILQKCYEELKSKGPLGGIFLFTEPSALVTDVDLLRNIFVKDFRHFQDRGMYVNERDDPLSAHLFSLAGEKWKALRAKLSPTFTSGKMKMMYPTMIDVAHKFNDNLLKLSGEGPATELEIRDLLARYTTDVIGNVAFGVECNSINEPKNELFRIGQRIIHEPTVVMLKNFLITMFPNASKSLRLSVTDSQVEKFILNLLSETVKYREDNDVMRNDFMSLLLQLKNTGRLEMDGEDLGKLTFNEMAAQVFVFFVAGFDTSSTTLTFAFYELALNPEIQERARQEVRDVMERHGGELTYEAAMELHYIDQIIQETLRKFPIVAFLNRDTTIPYKVPNTDIVLEKGIFVSIPVLGIHRDPANFPDPEKFDPERFTKENIAVRHPFSYMPFGLGPRVCIGQRFGMMQTRLAIATVLSNFQITPSKRTLIPMEFQPDGQLLIPKGGMFLNIAPIKV